MPELQPLNEKHLRAAYLGERDKRLSGRLLNRLYPDEGPLRRELYVPHQQFFAAGAQYRERCMLAANRIGKSLGVGGYEVTLHLTGLYPSWWVGRKFDRPINAWAAGDTGQTVRDIGQFKLLGQPGQEGTGLIPSDRILEVKRKAGSVPDAIETVLVKHVSGGYSRLTFKSYDQKRQAFSGTEQHVIWLDEECPESIYGECLMRTMTTDGLILLTFTPLMGLTPVVLMFLPGGKMPEPGEESSRFVVNATWDDAPHLGKAEKLELLESTPPHLRKARAMGIPHLGAGAIYPIAEEHITVAPFVLPDYWPRVYALDVGWNRTAAVWGAWDREEDTVYLYSEYYGAQAEPPIHAAGIKARGKWIPGVIDPSARGRGQVDGTRLLEEYEAQDLTLTLADNALEAGIYKVWTRLSTGGLKVFSTLKNWLTEYRLYRRDEKGKVVKEGDHLMDATRYLVLSGLDMAEPVPRADDPDDWRNDRMNETSGRSRVTGY